MPDYHGDFLYKMKPLYRHDDRDRYAVAMILLILFNIPGAHRFYLGQHGLGWFHLGWTAITVFVGFAALKFTFLFWMVVAHLVVCAAELVYMAINLAMKTCTIRADRDA